MSEQIKDGDWTLFKWDAEGQRAIWYMEQDGQLHWRIDQHGIDALLDDNEIARKATEGVKFGDWVRVASVPLNIYHDSGLADATKERDDKFVNRWLNDGDKAKFRTSRGQF